MKRQNMAHILCYYFHAVIDAIFRQYINDNNVTIYYAYVVWPSQVTPTFKDNFRYGFIQEKVLYFIIIEDKIILV